MSQQKRTQRAVKALQDIGVDVLTPEQSSHDPLGFVVRLGIAGDETIALNLERPPLLADLEQGKIGAAMLDSLGYVTASWGLARDLEALQPGRCALESRIQNLIKQAFRGSADSVYLDGVRYHATPVGNSEPYQIFVLVVDASMERSVRIKARAHQASAEALKEIGKTLTAHQSITALADAAIRVIANSLDASGALLWVAKGRGDAPILQAWTGARGTNLGKLHSLDPNGGSTCAAELAISHGDLLCLQDVRGSHLTRELEAEFCYVPAGGLAVMPLKCGERLVGVLEILGKRGDDIFMEKRDLFVTIGEHLSLALNSAIMFEEMEQLASRDALTGIPNHRTMQEFLHARVAEAARKGTELAVLMLDVDHFRLFNEQEGHDAGDEVLRMAATLMHDSIREYDMAARYGGEEFTVIMPGVGTEAVKSFAERLRSQIAELGYRPKTGGTRAVTASLGCAVYPHDATDASALIKAADVALYKAKRAGRNCTRMYDGDRLSAEKPNSEDPFEVFDLLPDVDRMLAKHRVDKFEHQLQALSEEHGFSDEVAALVRASFGAWNALLTDFTTTHSHTSAVSAVFELVREASSERTEKTSKPALVLATLAAFAEGGANALDADPERHDPASVNILRRLDPAA